MWKKTIPLIVLSGVLLVGCNNNDEVPNNNETPMQDVGEDAMQWEDNMERNNDNGNEGNTNRREDNLNDDEMNDGDDRTQAEIIEDFNRKNGVEENAEE